MTGGLPAGGGGTDGRVVCGSWGCCLMATAAYSAGTHAPTASRTCSVRSATRRLGPTVTSRPLSSIVPTRGFPMSSTNSLPSSLALSFPLALAPNSRSSMRMRSSFWRGSSAGPYSGGSLLQGRTSLEPCPVEDRGGGRS
ncbi:hypothetical protein CVT25_014334 [Psilocybe cyanescens]|uniref:Uncharacterized protein n=1 Tax=Psilocybe cyanescens TaxID=93625 RepID=A0A409XL66_PSICY|nr:hypothetical protein CVT25_014334 [Psilocybe cyanescens]